MTYVVDACAMIAYLRSEEGADTVWDILNGESHTCVAHAMNACEVYYDAVRRMDITFARNTIDDLARAGVEIRTDMGRAFWEMAGRYKAALPIAIADCFTIALTNRVEGVLATSDHAEFDRVSEKGICPVRFIR